MIPLLIHPWDAPRDDAEWQQWLSAHDLGQLAVNGLPGEAPYVQPLHFAYDAERAEAVTHLARPNPLWPALERNPVVLLSVVDDYTFIPGPWQAAPDGPPEHGTPTSFYAAVQLRCTAHVMDNPTGGRMLSGIRGIRLEVTDVRAKFKYAEKKPAEVQDRIAAGLAARSGPGDAGALAVLRRRRGL